MTGYKKWYYGLIPLSCIGFMIIEGARIWHVYWFYNRGALAYMIVNVIAGVRLMKEVRVKFGNEVVDKKPRAKAASAFCL